MQKLTPEFWDNNYRNNQTGWDIGFVSTPLKTYFDQIKDKAIRIIIPGAGNAYEAEYLWKNGFENVFVLDYSKLALQSFQSRFPIFPESNLLNEDFFLHSSEYDLIVEQTFFTALLPIQRNDYVSKTSQLLKSEGNLMGLLFNSHFNFDGPPFGGTQIEYENLFSPYYNFKILETANNSIKPRAGKELFFVFEKKS